LKNRLDDNLDETAKKGKFFLDEQGRLLDEKGNIVQIKVLSTIYKKFFFDFKN